MTTLGSQQAGAALAAAEARIDELEAELAAVGASELAARAVSARLASPIHCTFVGALSRLYRCQIS